MSGNLPDPSTLTDEALRVSALASVIQSRTANDGSSAYPIVTTYDALVVAMDAEVLFSFLKGGLPQAQAVHERQKDALHKLVEESTLLKAA